MSTLKVTNIQSNGTGFNDVVNFQNASGTNNGTLCRAWVNFNGTGTVAIRASFNVSSITDNGTGDYTVNFTTALADANYSVSMAGGSSTANGRICQPVKAVPSTSGQRVLFQDGNFNGFDTDFCFVQIFR